MSIDLNNPPSGLTYRLSVDKAETDGERKVRLFKDLALFVSALVVVGLVIGLSVHSLLTSDNPESQKLAWAFLSATAGGLVGYLVRK